MTQAQKTRSGITVKYLARKWKIQLITTCHMGKLPATHLKRNLFLPKCVSLWQYFYKPLIPSINMH